MPDKGVQGVQVSPACGLGTAAKVVFLAITFAEVGGVEQTHLVQSVTPDVHAKPNACGHVQNLPSVSRSEVLVQQSGVAVCW